MPVRPEVRDTQRTLAALDAAHARAIASLDQAVARRAEALANHDRQVVAAQAAVDDAVADMAGRISVELTAQLLGVYPTSVRRRVKAHRRSGPSAKRSGQ